MSKPKTIRLYPVPGVFADPWPSREFDATPDEWDAIREYVPPPFTDKRPPATGGVVTPGAVFLVGESGPETLMPPAARETAPEADKNP